MLGTITQWTSGITEERWRRAVRVPLKAVGDRMSTQPLTTAGLVISSTATLAKIGAADFYASVKGTLVKIAAGTDMPALTGLNVTATKFNVMCFFVDSAGVTTVGMGAEAATLGAIVFPPFAESKALVGFFIVNYASTFTGGTTHLDTAGVVYVSPLGPFDPTILL